MVDLAKAYGRYRDQIEQEIAKRQKSSESNNIYEIRAKYGVGRTWRGKRITTPQRWIKIQKKNDSEELYYIPDKYVEIGFFDRGDEILEKERSAWWKDWMEYLNTIKDERFGVRLCKECVLSTERYDHVEGIQKIMYEHLGKKTKNPCEIQNFFQCQYNEGEKSELQILNQVLRILDDAFSYAHRYDGMFVFDCYLKRGDLGTYGGTNPTYAIDGLLRKVAKPPMTVGTNKEMYDVLIDEEKLERLVEQYAEDRSHVGTKESKAEEELVREYKQTIVDVCTGIRSDFKYESMIGFYRNTISDVQKRTREHLEKHGMIRPPEPELDKCRFCENEGNFRCGRCYGRGFCSEHARLHTQDKSQWS